MLHSELKIYNLNQPLCIENVLNEWIRKQYNIRRFLPMLELTTLNLNDIAKLDIAPEYIDRIFYIRQNKNTRENTEWSLELIGRINIEQFPKIYFESKIGNLFSDDKGFIFFCEDPLIFYTHVFECDSFYADIIKERFKNEYIDINNENQGTNYMDMEKDGKYVYMNKQTNKQIEKYSKIICNSFKYKLNF